MTEKTPTHRPIRAGAAAILASLSLLLTGCFISPGKFTSELMLGPDQDFTFTYEGEIFFLGLSQLAQMGEASTEFEAKPCYVDSSDEVRECTRNEIEGQRAEWKAGAEERAAEAQKKAEQMAAIMGGVDSSNPESISEFIAMLERQKGWQKVVDKGDGLFEISYRLEGKLTHDFLFPVIEGVPTTNPFVEVLLRDGNVARINAPGFATQNDNNPLAAMMGGMGAIFGMAELAPDKGDEGNNTMPNFPQLDGTFTIVTAAGTAIRANNTDEGPEASEAGQRLSWQISSRTKTAPTALISLSE